jgi:hypothetical protein
MWLISCASKAQTFPIKNERARRKLRDSADDFWESRGVISAIS